jgi:tripartite-type tricarboxylate transporter receptor subunit TctC
MKIAPRKLDRSKHMTRSQSAARFARNLALIMFAVPAIASVPSIAAAQDFPTRPVRIVVPAAPGGALDTISRLLAHKVSESWKQPVYIENKPGANWTIGMDAVAKAAPDGYTLLFIASSGLTIVPLVYPNIPLDPLKDLAPIAIATSTSFVLLVNPDLPVKSVAELVAYARANPGKLNHASNSTTTILVSELFKTQAKIDYVDVNFRGASEAIVATQGGTTQLCFVDLGTGSSAIAGKTLRPLALTAPEPYPLAPDIPTFAQAGLPGMSVLSLTLVVAPANVPREVMSTLRSQFQQALEAPDVQAKLRGMGQVVSVGAAEDPAKVLIAESEQWKKLIKERNIHFEN